MKNVSVITLRCSATYVQLKLSKIKDWPSRRNYRITFHNYCPKDRSLNYVRTGEELVS